MIVPARAKLNLTLHVLAREESGFHQIETMFCAIELADEVEVTLRDGDGDVSLDVVSGGALDTVVDLGPVEQNLAYRAALAFREAAGGVAGGAGGGVHIRLAKRIPAGAGLGGGSSDAAAVLHALNELHGHPLAEQALLEVGDRLGSDVPFLLSGAPLALAWGRGGRLLPLPPLPGADVLLAVPREGVRTADAYSALAHRREENAARGGPAVQLAPRSWDEVAAVAANDFETIVFQRLPQIGAVRQKIEECGATIARLTGTGSVVFGIFEDPAVAAEAAKELAAAFPDVALIASRTCSPLA